MAQSNTIHDLLRGVLEKTHDDPATPTVDRRKRSKYDPKIFETLRDLVVEAGITTPKLRSYDVEIAPHTREVVFTCGDCRWHGELACPFTPNVHPYARACEKWSAT